MRVHFLKCDPRPYTDLLTGIKSAEVRQNDRLYEAGDVLYLREYVRAVRDGAYTGRSMIMAVTHVQRGYGLPDGLVVLSVRTPTETQREQAEAHIRKQM